MTHDHTYHPNTYLNVLFGCLSVLLTSIDWVLAESVIEGVLKILVLAVTLFSLVKNLKSKPNHKQDEKDSSMDIG